jgi:hypothetical protein
MFLSLLSLIVAVCAFVFSLFTYFAHDKVLKSQEKRINDYQLKVLAREDEETKKAKIRGNIIPSRSNGGRVLKIFNAGYVSARNVSVEWLNPDDRVLVRWDFGIIGEITPQNGRSYNILLMVGYNEIMRLRYMWADDYSENNVFEEDLQL